MRSVVLVATLAVSSSALAQSSPTERQRQGAAALLAGKLDDAEALYQQALAEPAPDAPVWFDLCLVRYAAGDFGGAINACYRALPADENRVLWLLREIWLAMKAAKVSPRRVMVPEPTRSWFLTQGRLSHVVSAAEPTAEAGVVRVAPELPLRGVGVDDVLEADELARLRGPRPVLPYRAKVPPEEYARGVNVSSRVGALFYAPDASPFLVGGRVEVIHHAPEASGHLFYFGEYLHAPDSTGGLISGGVGGAGGWFIGTIGLAIPWGRSEGRNGIFQNHVTGLHSQFRYGLYKQLMLGRSWAISVDVSILGGFDFGQLAAQFGHSLKDICLLEDDCPDKPDPYPGWPFWHWGFQAGISMGPRSGHPPYPRAHVFRPMGGS